MGRWRLESASRNVKSVKGIRQSILVLPVRSKLAVLSALTNTKKLQDAPANGPDPLF